ncbi:MAG: 2OG-Fe(II) oxygenase [Pseudomonadota bacterium]|nr:2OG-Fe(II) oxygenase [Pseudomonadota bacterium]
MPVQPITPELRRWIVAQATAGHPPDIVLDAMKASGWDEAVALDALETTMKSHLGLAHDDASIAGEAATEPARPVPGARIVAGASAIRAGDRDVRVVMAMTLPRVVVFADLLSADECAELIALARSRLARSETVETTTGASAVNAARTSDGMFFEPGEFAVCARLETRIAALLGWPLENGEGLQILRYGPGTEYRPHFDYFDPDEAGTPAILRRGGQRVGSIVCYLNTPEAGGATVFPDVGLEVAPVRGNAVFFSYDRPHPATRTLHGGAPVDAGEKWVATKWLREGRFE